MSNTLAALDHIGDIQTRLPALEFLFDEVANSVTLPEDPQRRDQVNALSGAFTDVVASIARSAEAAIAALKGSEK